MSRTVRRDRKSFKKVPDGTARYKCRCSYCMGVTRRKFEKDVLDKEIKDTVDLYYGDVSWNQNQIWNRFYDTQIDPTLEEEINWINYRSAA